MTGHFEYKGYLGSAEVDVDSGVLVGQLLYIRDTIAYSGKTFAQLKKAFHEAVNDYLKVCAAEGDEPDVPLKGSFNVRVGPERHRKAAIAARKASVTLNEFVCAAVDEALRGQHRPPYHLTFVADEDSIVRGTVALATASVSALPEDPRKVTVTTGGEPAIWEHCGTVRQQ